MKLKLLTILLLISSYTFAFELEILAAHENDSLVASTGYIFGSDDHVFISYEGEPYVFTVTKIVKSNDILHIYCDDIIIGMQFLKVHDGHKLFNFSVIIDGKIIPFLTKRL